MLAFTRCAGRERSVDESPARGRLVRALVALLLASLAAGCAGATYDRPADDSSEQPVKLANDSFFIALFELDRPSHVRIDVATVSGGAVDVWLATGAMCDAFAHGGFEPTRTAFATTNATLEVDLPRGRGCVPIDNTDIAPGLANATGPVEASYRLQVWHR